MMQWCNDEMMREQSNLKTLKIQLNLASSHSLFMTHRLKILDNLSTMTLMIHSLATSKPSMSLTFPLLLPDWRYSTASATFAKPTNGVGSIATCICLSQLSSTSTSSMDAVRIARKNNVSTRLSTTVHRSISLRLPYVFTSTSICRNTHKYYVVVNVVVVVVILQPYSKETCTHNFLFRFKGHIIIIAK